MVASESGWALQVAFLAYLEQIWTEPDQGIWEMRSLPRHFTYSKVMAWVAFDRRTFLACSFWLVDTYVLQKRWHDARALFDRLLDLRNDVGLLSEQCDPRSQRQIGNFPHAFTHVALINSAFNLTRSEKPAEQRTHAEESSRVA